MLIQLSHALSVAIDRAGLSVADIDRAIDRENLKGEGCHLDPWHDAVQAVSRASGLGHMSINRRNGHLLMWTVNNSPFWTYDERSRRDCRLRIPHEVPETARLKLIGMTVGHLISVSDLIDRMQIASVEHEPGWTVAQLDVPWTERPRMV